MFTSRALAWCVQGSDMDSQHHKMGAGERSCTQIQSGKPECVQDARERRPAQDKDEAKGTSKKPSF